MGGVYAGEYDVYAVTGRNGNIVRIAVALAIGGILLGIRAGDRGRTAKTLYRFPVGQLVYLILLGLHFY